MGQTETHCPHRIQTVGACSRGCSQGARHRRPLVLGSTGASRLFWVTPVMGPPTRIRPGSSRKPPAEETSSFSGVPRGTHRLRGGLPRPRHRHGPVGQGEAFVQCLAHRKGCRDVEDHTAYVLRPASPAGPPGG